MGQTSQTRTYHPEASVVFLKTKECFGGLSNMSTNFPLRVNKICIHTSEALYQACRFPHLPDVQAKIINERSPMTAKMRGKPHRNQSRADWGAVRVKIMRWCLRVKLAQNWKVFGELLLETGDQPIVERSHRDDFWGAKVDDGLLIGMNVLGRLLMELREQLAADTGEHLKVVEPLPIPEFLLFQQPIKTVFGDENYKYPVSGDNQDTLGTTTPALADGPQISFLDQSIDSQNQADIRCPKSLISDRNKGLQPYPSYQDSGLPWINELPTHWKIQRTKTILKERSKKGHPDEPLLAATQSKGVVRKEQYENRTVMALKDLHLLKLVRVDDFVISLRSFQGGIEYARTQGIISPAYTILYAKHPGNHSYLAHLFKSKPYIENLELFVTGIRQGQNIDYEKLGRSGLPLPPLPEQTAIVRYLDYVDRRVRRFVRAKEKLIGLLDEQKQVIIHRAVTRGLDPDVPLKPSGVEWLGEVPEHWEVIPLKRIVWFNSGAGFPISLQGRTDEEILFVKVSDMNILGNEYKITRSVNTVSRDVAHNLGAYVFQKNAIIFPKVGGALLTNKRRMLLQDTCIDNNLMGCVVTGADVNFAFRILLWLDLGRLAKPGPVPAISEGEVREIRIPLPPRSEQTAIVEYLDKATADIDTAITRARREVELLNEYRTRLIADVVTGKLDVREAAAQLPDETGEPEPP